MKQILVLFLVATGLLALIPTESKAGFGIYVEPGYFTKTVTILGIPATIAVITTSRITTAITTVGINGIVGTVTIITMMKINGYFPV